jgi:hypothetical protein
MKRLFVHPRGSLLTAAAMLTLAACSGAVTVTGHKNISGAYRPGELYVVATGDNELRTIIVGNPFDLPKAEFDKAVLATLKGRNIGPTLNLSTNPKQEDPRKRHVLLVFNIAGPRDATDLCRATSDPAIADRPDGNLSVTAVYCAGDLPLTQAAARAGQVSGVDSDRFRTLLSQTALALFPATNRRHRPGSE